MYEHMVFSFGICNTNSTGTINYIPGKLQFMLFEEYNSLVYFQCLYVPLLRFLNSGN